VARNIFFSSFSFVLPYFSHIFLWFFINFSLIFLYGPSRFLHVPLINFTLFVLIVFFLFPLFLIETQLFSIKICSVSLDFPLIMLHQSFFMVLQISFLPLHLPYFSLFALQFSFYSFIFDLNSHVFYWFSNLFLGISFILNFSFTLYFPVFLSFSYIFL